MNTSYKVSYSVVLGLIFLLPIFFIPSYLIPVALSKTILITLAAIIAFAALLIDTFKDEGVSLPKHYLMWGILALPLVYFASALVSKTQWISLFGYTFEPGTAASILILCAVLGITATVFNDRARIIKGYTALFISLAILCLFALIKIFSGGDLLVLKNFAGNMGNPVGAWTDYAMVFALLSVLSMLALEMLPLKGVSRVVVWILFALGLILLSIVNFSMTWVLVLVAAIVMLVYFVTLDKARLSDVPRSKRAGVVAASILGIVALLFVWNPTVSSTQGTISNVIAAQFGISNSDVRPTLSTTLEVTKTTLGGNLILGSGPNTFGSNWLLHKPSTINSTPFWNVVFPFGVGFIPTQLASTGLLGTLVWTIFFILLAILGLRAFAYNPEQRSDKFLLVSSLIGTLFLWISAFVYMPSMAILTLAFIFLGLFVASCAITGVVGVKTIQFSKNSFTHFASVLAMIILAAGTLSFVFIAYQKVSATIHFQRAVVLANTQGSSIDSIESELMKAVNLSPADSYLASLSQVELSRANLVLSSTTGTPEENSQLFQTALARAIAYLQNAINLNPTYGNWIALGNIYASLVPEPLKVDGAYDSAKAAYDSAELLNPTSPEISLLRAQLELARADSDAARAQIEEALRRKADYADAYFLLAQLEVSENNLSEAIRSAETGVLLSPGNPGVIFQLGLLKFANQDYRGAREAFEASLQILPDYANAKYYLGLSYDELGMKAEAIELFEDLAQTNPDNEAVKLVLANLRAGKPATTGLDNSGSTSRTIPPITNQ